MAGSSAKAEETTVAAVKRAIFHDPIHAAEVRARIGQLQPKKILILGTSEKMIDRITAALNLPAVKYKIFIQDIATPEQIGAGANHAPRGQARHPAAQHRGEKGFAQLLD